MSPTSPLARLAWSRPLERRETASGFASRLACLNGRRLSVLLREMVVAPRDVDLALPDAVRAVALLGGVDAEELLRFTPARAVDERYRELAGERVLRHSVHRTYFKFCPACVSDDLERFDGRRITRPWLRLEWTLSHFRSCGIHGVALTQAAPKRRGFEPLDYSETMSAMLADISRLVDDSREAAPSPFQDWLDDRLGGIRDAANWLDAMPLYVSVGFCEALGVSALHDPKVQTSGLDEAQWAEAADCGFEVASRGPGSLSVLLGELNGAQRSTRGVWAPRDSFGYAYGLLQKTLGDPAYEPVRAVFREFALANMPLEPGSDLLGEPVSARTVHTIHSAAKAAGVHNRSMRTLFERHGIGVGTEELRDHRVVATADEVEQLVVGLRDALTSPQVEQRTGIHRMHLRAMVAEGHLPTLTGTAGSAYAKHRFAPAAVDELVRRMFDGAEEVLEATGRRVPIMRARNMSHASNERILALLFGGELSWKGRIAGRSDYDALLVDADELTRIVRSEGPRANYTKEEIANAVPGIDRRNVERLAAAGYLDIVEEFSPEARRMIPVVSRESAEAFLKRFVSLGELTRATGLHHKKVRLLLRGVDIEAAVDPDKVGAFLYDRARVETLVAKRPEFWTYDKKAAQDAAR